MPLMYQNLFRSELMDLKGYYKKIREIEFSIPAPYVVLVGLETPEGGKGGTKTETARGVAAKLISEGRARLATTEETETFHELNATARREAEASAAAQRMQVTLVGHADLKGRSVRTPKE